MAYSQLRASDFAFSASPLGRGNLCVVLRARHRDTGRVFAVKRIDKSAVRRAALRAPGITNAILQEKAVAARVAGLVGAKLHGTFSDAECVFLVYDYCDGGELWNAVMEGPDAGIFGPLAHTAPAEPRHPVALDVDVARALVAWLVRSLAVLRAAGVAHRDIKPENIMLRRERCAEEGWGSREDDTAALRGPFSLALIDWGSAKVFEPSDTKYNGSDSTGSLEYMAPEAIDNVGVGGGIPTNSCADLWSLGVTTARLVTGVLAWAADSPYLSSQRALAHEAKDAGDEGAADGMTHEVDGLLFAPGTPADAASFIRGLLRRRPLERIGVRALPVSLSADADIDYDTLLSHPFLRTAPRALPVGALVPSLSHAALRTAVADIALAPCLSVDDLRSAFALRDGGLRVEGETEAQSPAILRWVAVSRCLRQAPLDTQARVLHALAVRRRASLPHIFSLFCESLGAARAWPALVPLSRIGTLSPREHLGWNCAPETFLRPRGGLSGRDEIAELALGSDSQTPASGAFGWKHVFGAAWVRSQAQLVVVIAHARAGAPGGEADALLARAITAINKLQPPPLAVIFVGDAFSQDVDAAVARTAFECALSVLQPPATVVLIAAPSAPALVPGPCDLSSEIFRRAAAFVDARNNAHAAWARGVRLLVCARPGTHDGARSRSADSWLRGVARAATSVAQHTILFSGEEAPSGSVAAMALDDLAASASGVRCVVAPSRATGEGVGDRGAVGCSETGTRERPSGRAHVFHVPPLSANAELVVDGISPLAALFVTDDAVVPGFLPLACHDWTSCIRI